MRHVLELLVAELAKHPDVLRLHSARHIAAVAIRWQDSEARLVEEIADLSTMILVETCRRHECPGEVRKAAIAARFSCDNRGDTGGSQS